MDGTVAAARVVDTAPATRFNPLRMEGRAGLADGLWTADLSFATPAGHAIAKAALRHDASSASGGVAIRTGMLNFADGGLQPVELSPLAAAVGSPAMGSADRQSTRLTSSH